MSLHAQLRPLLAQFVNATGRGNIILANQTLVRIIETLANSIEQRDHSPPPHQEPAGLEPAMIWDQRPDPPKRRKPAARRVTKPRRRKPA